MRLGFVFDVRFIRYNGHYYSINLTRTLWQRYLQFVDDIVVIGRQYETSEDVSTRLIQSDFDDVQFRCIEEVSPLKRFFRMNAEKKFIAKAIEDCDIVICRSWWGVDVCKRLNKPYMMEVISCTWDSYWNHSLMGKLVAIPFFIKQRKAVKEAPYVLYVTNEFLQRRYPTEGNQIGCSDVVLQETDKSVLQKRLEKINANDGRKIIIGTTAAVNVRYKGQQYVIEALGYLKKLGIVNYEYQLAGNGDPSFLKEAAKMYDVEDQVKFLGGVSHDQVFDWLDSLDLYVQPSRQEGLPRALVEAMSRGLPAFGARTGGIPELLDNDYIFSNTRRNIREIADIVMEFSKDRMLEQARRNYDKAGEFQKEKLDKKRNEFYRAFFEN